MNSSSFFFRVQALPLEWALLHNRRHPILPDHQRRVWLAIASDHWLWVIYLYKLGWPVPDYSTICRRQKTLTVDISHRPRRGDPESVHATRLSTHDTGVLSRWGKGG